LKSNDDIDAAVNNLTNVIQSAAWVANAAKNIHATNTNSLPTNIHILISEKTELFKNYLFNVFQPHQDIPLVNSSTVLSYLDMPLPPSLPVKHFSPSDIKFAIQKSTLRKSPGFNLITAEIARCLPKRAIVLLIYIFNAILRLLYFPLLWKFSKIILFPKPN